MDTVLYFDANLFITSWVSPQTLTDLWISECKRRLTHDIIALEAQLVGLAGLKDLHPDELNLRLAVLKHLLGRR